MSDLSSLYTILRFFRDLGVDDIYLPTAVPAVKPLSFDRTTPSCVMTSGTRTAGGTPSVPENSNIYLATDLLASTKPAEPSENSLPELQSIQEDIGDCTRCVLHKGRTNIVFGVGNVRAKVVFIGEGPGADEDAQGIPFVGRAGQLLTQMIDNTAKGEGLSIKRRDVYICNVVKCRPPGNRAPKPDEMSTCGQFLDRQLKEIRPKAICVLGNVAAKYLLNTREGITRLRGQWQEWKGIPVMPTYHPSFLLRAYNQDKKRETWEDLKKVFHFVYD